MKSNSLTRFQRERVRGIFVCKKSVEQDDCKQLVEELGCSVIGDGPKRLTVETTRNRMQELKLRYVAKTDDASHITSRLQKLFDNVLVGGPTPGRKIQLD